MRVIARSIFVVMLVLVIAVDCVTAGGSFPCGCVSVCLPDPCCCEYTVVATCDTCCEVPASTETPTNATNDEELAPPAPSSGPVESPATVAPVQPAVPSLNDIPETPASSPETKTPSVVGDRYSEPPAPVAPTKEATDEEDIFDEPASEAEEIKPKESASKPKLDVEDLFGPDNDEPESSSKSESESDDPFGESLGIRTKPSVLNLRSAMRTWASDTAKLRDKAQLVQVTTKNIVLQQASGAQMVVSFSRLTDQDLRFVHQQVVALRLARVRDAAAAKLATTWGN